MSEDPSPPRRPPSAADRAKEVAELLRTIQQDAEEREFVRLDPGPPPRSPIWYLALALAVVLNLWIWIDRPAWLVGATPTQVAELQREQALRFQMYLQGQRIEAFRVDNGDLPGSLEEAGPPVPGIRYQRSGLRSWEILGESEGLRLILRGSQEMDEFLGPYETLLGLEET